MIALQSTSFQFGGAVLTSDDPMFEATLQRIADMIMLFLIQSNRLLMELRVLVGLQTTLAQRTIDIMDVSKEYVEVLAVTPGVALQQMAERWGVFWFKRGWSYGI